MTGMEKSPLFLSLPANIRIQIYRYCGLVRSCPIDLNSEGVRHRLIAVENADKHGNTFRNMCRYKVVRQGSGYPEGYPPGLECFCVPIPIQILLISRPVSEEAFRILYGENQFKVSRHENDLPGDRLERCRALSSKAWGSMQSLNIDLTEICADSRHGSLQTALGGSVDGKTVEGDRILRTWSSLCKDVLYQIPANQLKLSLSCNVSDLETALRVTIPLVELQPLKESSICLSADPKQKTLKEKAQRAALQLVANNMTRKNERSQIISWNDLPKEIRISILGYTDLNHTPRRYGVEIEAGKQRQRVFACCLKCTSTLSVCHCSFMHAAFSTTCTCPSVASNLALVSRLMHSEMIEVFFSRNRFNLSGDFAASRQYLWSLPPSNAQHLRTIDLKVSSEQIYEMDNLKSQMPLKWDTLVASIARLLNCPGLWLSIDVAQPWVKVIGSQNGEIEREYDMPFISYSKLLDPLYRHLTGVKLRRFHVFLRGQPNYESTVEKKVMGSDYDSHLEGKPQSRDRDYFNPHIKWAPW